MKSLLLPVATVLFSSLATHCIADEPATDGQTTFREFGEFMVGGVWTHTDEKGNELEHVYRWAAHQQCVVMRTIRDPDAGAGIIHVDPETGKCIWHGFNHGPTYGARVAETVVESLDENQWKISGKSVGEDATLSGEWTVTGNGDTLRIQGQPTLNGEKQPPVDITWRRRKITATKEEFAEFLHAMTGKWTGNVTLAQDIPGIGKKGENAKVTGESLLTANGDALVWQATDDRGGRATSLAYYDAKTRQIRERIVFSGGTVISTIFVKDGERWLAHHVTTDPDGAVTRATDVLVISDDGNTHTWTRGGVQSVWKRGN